MYCRTRNLAEGEREFLTALALDLKQTDVKKAIRVLLSLRGANDNPAGANLT